MVKSMDSNAPMGSTVTLLKDAVDRKADLIWVDARLKTVEELGREAKEIALIANRKASERHMCNQEEKIEDITETLKGWSRVKIGAIISIVALILAGAGQYFALKNSVQNTQDSVLEVKESVRDLDSSYLTMKDALSKKEEEAKKQDKEKMDEIKDAIRKALYEVSSRSNKANNNK